MTLHYINTFTNFVILSVCIINPEVTSHKRAPMYDLTPSNTKRFTEMYWKHNSSPDNRTNTKETKIRPQYARTWTACSLLVHIKRHSRKYEKQKVNKNTIKKDNTYKIHENNSKCTKSVVFSLVPTVLIRHMQTQRRSTRDHRDHGYTSYKSLVRLEHIMHNSQASETTKGESTLSVQAFFCSSQLRLRRPFPISHAWEWQKKRIFESGSCSKKREDTGIRSDRRAPVTWATSTLRLDDNA